MRKFWLVLALLPLFSANTVWAQAASLNKAKYVTIIKVVSAHKLNDKNLTDDVSKLRSSEKFNRDLRTMVEKLDNNRPNNAKNQRVMRILEKAGMDIYNELK